MTVTVLLPGTLTAVPTSIRHLQSGVKIVPQDCRELRGQVGPLSRFTEEGCASALQLIISFQAIPPIEVAIHLDVHLHEDRS